MHEATLQAGQTAAAGTNDTPVSAEPILAGRKTVARILDVSVATVTRWDAAGKMPAARRIGGRRLWSVRELKEWAARPKPSGELMTREEWQAMDGPNGNGRPRANGAGRETVTL